jgi:DNA-binding MarR family transcriptional regulator
MESVGQAQPLVQQDQGEDPGGVLPLIQRISTLVEKRCDRFLSSRWGLTTPQFQVLLIARRQADVTLGGLSDQLNCSRGNVTGIVDRLERDQWLTRERSAHDRRVITVRLTEKGEQIPQIQAELDGVLASLAEVWSPEQQHLLTDLLYRIYQELKD